MHPRRLRHALLVSAVVHALALALLLNSPTSTQEPALKKLKKSIKVARVQLPPATPKALETPWVAKKQPSQSRPVAKNKPSQSRPVAKAAATAKPLEPASPENAITLPKGPRRPPELTMPQLKLSKLAAEAAATEHRLRQAEPQSERARVAERLAQIARDGKSPPPNVGPYIGPEAKDFGTRLHQWFTLPSSLREQLFAGGKFPPLMECQRDTSFPTLCFGACGANHLQGTVAVVLEIEHDQAGAPADWRVVQSSGFIEVDQAAMNAVRDSRAFSDPGLFKQGTELQWSRWMFAAEAHRWSGTELLLDPGFNPDGDELASESSMRGKTTISRRAVLLSARYHSQVPPTPAPAHGQTDP